MQGVKGNDNFQEGFDFFEWSAPYYLTPKDVIVALQSIGYKGKKVRNINLIGVASNIGKTGTGLLYRRITDAGIDPGENWYTQYPHIDEIKLPWECRACEPIQFVFEDDSTLEIMPTEDGGARIATNTIPIGLMDGLNHSNFDASIFFSEAIGKEIRDIDMRVERKIKQYVDDYTIGKDKPHEEIRTEYRFCIDFEYPIKMELVQSWESWYSIKMRGSGWDAQIPYSRVKASQKSINQVRIVNGRDGNGVFWIVPICSKEKEDTSFFFIDNYGISIDDGDVSSFLGPFLYKYFDPAIQKREDYYEDQCSFDWYGSNRYSFDSMRKMLDDISRVITLLETDYDNPVLSEIKNGFYWLPYTNKRKDELTDSEINELRKNCVPEAVDFYSRFTRRIKSMMMLPGRDTMSFAGP